jgi:hypothetical protein
VSSLERRKDETLVTVGSEQMELLLVEIPGTTRGYAVHGIAHTSSLIHGRLMPHLPAEALKLLSGVDTIAAGYIRAWNGNPQLSRLHLMGRALQADKGKRLLQEIVVSDFLSDKLRVEVAGSDGSVELHASLQLILMTDDGEIELTGHAAPINEIVRPPSSAHRR